MTVRLADFANPPMTMAEAEAARRGKPISKGETRLEKKIAETKLTVVDEKAFKAQVIKRDGKRCRCCGVKIVAALERIPNRREIHHIHGRTGALRFESRAALQLCLRCHERCTGKVKTGKLQIVPTKTFQLFSEKTRREETYTDATFPVVFKEGE